MPEQEERSRPRKPREATRSEEKTIKLRKKKSSGRGKTTRKKGPSLFARIKKKRPFISLRWRISITYLLLLGLALLVAGYTYVQIISANLIQQENAAKQSIVAELSRRLGEYMEASDGDAMVRLALEQGRIHNGRVLVLDINGRVLVDSFSQYEGLRMEHDEVRSILYGSKEFDAGLYELDVGGGEEGLWSRLYNTLIMQNNDRLWVGYYTGLISVDSLQGNAVTSQKAGVALLSVPIQATIDNITEQQDQMIAVFAVVALAVLLASIFFSQVINRPIVELTNSITRMARGDFSQRVHPRGNNEIAQLGESFNIMGEKLKMLDDSRNQFISNASHELKTPLSTMKLLVHPLLHQADMPPELQTEFLGDIDSEIDRLSTIISDLLTLVQIDSRGMVLSREELSLDALTEATVHRLAPQVRSRRLTLEMHIAEGVSVNADPARLEQVIYNLTDNAIKYTPNGGAIRIELTREGKNAVLKVSDSGIGIPEQDLPHIFDRFYRVDKARSRETGGTGLGLSIVQQIVLLHGGEIVALSKENTGSTFIVTIPATGEKK